MTTSANDSLGHRGQFAELVVLCAEKGILKKAVFSKSCNKEILRATVTARIIGKRLMLQYETFHADNKAKHQNLDISSSDAKNLAISAVSDIIGDFMQINLISTVGDCEYKRSSSGKETLLRVSRIRSVAEEKGVSVTEPVCTSGNNREKNYILNGREPFLILLGVSDQNGRIYDKKRPKFRQINRFLELIRDVEGHLPADGTLRICDLCCGKSYLSFAVYHYFANILGRNVRMTGVDLKPDVIEHCSSVAKKLGFDGLEFVCGDITGYVTDQTPQLVISLHACDTATDIVLDKAVEWKADVILSTPCCHHELNHMLNCPQLSFIAEHSMLRQKFCDAATDALRLKLLESYGYFTAALELIDPEETPKNIMLRAVRQKKIDVGSAKAQKARAEYENAKRFLLSLD